MFLEKHVCAQTGTEKNIGLVSEPKLRYHIGSGTDKFWMMLSLIHHSLFPADESYRLWWDPDFSFRVALWG